MRKSLAIASAFLLLCGMAQSQPHQRSNRKPQPDNTARTPTQSPQPSTVNQIFGASNDPVPPRQAQQSKLRQFLDKAQSDPIVWLTLIIAIFAGVQVGVYISMHATMKQVERAYVHVGEIQLFRFEPGSVPRIVVPIMNKGKTPAVIFRAAARRELLVAEPKGPPPFTNFHELDFPLGTDQREMWGVDFEREMTQAELDLINGKLPTAPKGIMIVSGRIDYRDQFGGKRFMLWGRRYDPEQSADKPYFAWEPTKGYNKLG